MKMREEQKAMQLQQVSHSSAMRESSFSLEHWVKDPSLLEFYYNLKHKKRDE
jgi:hypothetical protein